MTRRCTSHVGAFAHRWPPVRSSRALPSARTRRSERGAVGGAEGLLFGMLILIAGSIVVVNLWAVVDTRAALDAGAREYLRTYTERADSTTAATQARLVLDDVLRSRGTDPADVLVRLETPNGFGPCALARVELTTVVRGVRAPFLDAALSTEVGVEHHELIDAHREVTADANYDPTATACATG